MESSGTAATGSVWAARVYVLSYIVILNVRFHTICVKHQKVSDIINSWDKGMWQDITFHSMCWLLSNNMFYSICWPG